MQASPPPFARSDRTVPHPASAQTSTVRLDIPVEPFPTGWQLALGRPPKVEVFNQWLGGGLQDRPKTVSLHLSSKVPVKTVGCVFPESPQWFDSQRSARSGQTKSGSASSPAPAIGGRSRKQAPQQAPQLGGQLAGKLARIRPPGDVIKLEDRLYYLLQPPLDTMIRCSEIRFPFEPFPYQFDGIAFLYPRVAAILADEMGLGKTMQAITTIRLLLHASELRNVLLICPKPLVTNWQREFTQWAPEIPIGIIEGDKEKRQWQWQQPRTPVKIANYELLMRDGHLLTGDDLCFDLVVLDEAQRIKNASSTTSRVVKKISRRRSWALTGTPVENSPDDLVGIFDFLAPGFLNRDMRPRKMGEAAHEYILRRTKDMVLSDLPPKMFRDAEVNLTSEQWERYAAAEGEGVLHLNEMGEGLTIQHVFELVLRLKQICNFDPLTGASAKLERLQADLEEVAASGKKAIVFSQWVQTLEMIRERIRPYRPLEYHGRIPSKKRDGIIEQFKTDPDRHVLLMSYGAGSVGLNLQFCEYVFLFDRWWNPAIEDQAVNRAHRIGAAGPVTVTRMLTLNTIEERINQVLEEKRELFATIFSDNASPRSSGLKRDEIFGLFNLRLPV